MTLFIYTYIYIEILKKWVKISKTDEEKKKYVEKIVFCNTCPKC